MADERRGPTSRRYVGVLLLGAISLLVSLAILRMHSDSSRSTSDSDGKGRDMAPVGRVPSAPIQAVAAEGEQTKCTRPVTITASVMGSYMESLQSPDQYVTITRPS